MRLKYSEAADWESSRMLEWLDSDFSKFWKSCHGKAMQNVWKDVKLQEKDINYENEPNRNRKVFWWPSQKPEKSRENNKFEYRPVEFIYTNLQTKKKKKGETEKQQKKKETVHEICDSRSDVRMPVIRDERKKENMRFVKYKYLKRNVSTIVE